MKDHTCGCCEGVEPLTPLPTANRPGLDELSYRVGTHATFFETMVARLTSHRLDDGRRPLQKLTTRDPEDLSLALLDAWATVADVLTFYQERIANEGYLRTANERRSVLELARLVGYTPRPGVAASVFLAFTLEDDVDIEIPAGTLARSIPGPEELPQPFETQEDLPARTVWNALSARLTRPFILRPDADFIGTRRLFLGGTATGLDANDAVLVVCGSVAFPYTVRAIETDTEADRTTATYTPYGTGISFPEPETPARDAAAAAEAPALTRLSDVVRALRKDPSLQPANRFKLERSPERTYAATADLGPRLLTQFTPRLAGTLYAAYANAPVTGVSPDELCHVEALRVKAAPFGNNAPQDLVYRDNVLVGRREWTLAELRATLDVALSSTEPAQRVDDAFRQDADLPAQVFPPLRLAITVSDETGTPHARTVELRELQEVPPPADAPGPLHRLTFLLEAAQVIVSAQYEDEGTVQALRTLSVRFVSGSRQRDVIVREGSSLNGSSAFRVQATGTTLVDVRDGDVIANDLPQTSRRVTIALDSDALVLRITQEEPHFLLNQDQLRRISLDATYDGISPGSWVLLDRPDRLHEMYRVSDVRTLSRADYGVTAKVTQLLLDRPWISDQDTSLSLLRRTTVFAQSEALALSEEPIEADVAGGSIELDGLYERLEAGRWVVVKGERTDVRDGNDQIVEGIEASELAMLAGVEHDVQRVVDADGNERERPTDTLHTRLILAEPLAYTYKHESVTINANVARATHGETLRETLGSGNAAKAFQAFTLGQAPLTFVAAPTPSGVESTLDVRVNDVRWPEQKTLLYLGGNDRGYETKTDDDGRTTVVFGDGKRGARLPTGVENVAAVYRAGIGKAGNVQAGQISVLGSRPLGVQEVVNPERASGGADPESRDQARRNVPLGVLALDRLVSVQDYADFARTFAGIGKAQAAGLSDGQRSIVHLTIAGADDASIDEQSDLYRNLLSALGRFGDRSVPLQVAPREAVFIFISARVKVLEDYLWETVEPEIRAALLDTFSFDRRELGQDVWLSQAIGVIQGIKGVDYVDVDLLDAVSETDAADPETLAEKLEALAAASGAASSPANACDGATQPNQRLVVELARIDPAGAGGAPRIRPAQMAYLNPGLPDTLILTEASA